MTAIKKPEIVAEPLFLKPFVPTALHTEWEGSFFHFESETGQSFGQVFISVVSISR
jgi:hypothetical protein